MCATNLQGDWSVKGPPALCLIWAISKKCSSNNLMKVKKIGFQNTKSNKLKIKQKPVSWVQNPYKGECFQNANSKNEKKK